MTDEELKKQFGIHLTTRLTSDDPVNSEAKWADIDDDDDDWVPEAIEWGDGTKFTLNTDDHSTSSPAPAKPEPEPVKEPVRTPAPVLPPPPPTPATPLQLARAAAPTGSLKLSTGPKTLVTEKAGAKGPPASTAPPARASPWAKIAQPASTPPVAASPPKPRPAEPLRREEPPRESSDVREVSAEGFERSWRERGHVPGHRELFNSETGQLEPVQEGRNRAARPGRSEQQVNKPAVLQRPSAPPPPAEPSPAFQQHRSSINNLQRPDEYRRRRTSSNVSGGSGSYGRRPSVSRFSADQPSSDETGIPRGKLGSMYTNPFDEQQDSLPSDGPRKDSPSHPSPKLQYSEVSPTMTNASLSSATRPPVAVQQPVQQPAQPPAQPPADLEEDLLLKQDRIMKEGRELARKRRQEEEEREEAAKKERLRVKLELLERAEKEKEEAAKRAEAERVAAERRAAEERRLAEEKAAAEEHRRAVEAEAAARAAETARRAAEAEKVRAAAAAKAAAAVAEAVAEREREQLEQRARHGAAAASDAASASRPDFAGTDRFGRSLYKPPRSPAPPLSASPTIHPHPPPPPSFASSSRSAAEPSPHSDLASSVMQPRFSSRRTDGPQANGAWHQQNSSSGDRYGGRYNQHNQSFYSGGGGRSGYHGSNGGRGAYHGNDGGRGGPHSSPWGAIGDRSPQQNRNDRSLNGRYPNNYNGGRYGPAPDQNRYGRDSLEERKSSPITDDNQGERNGLSGEDRAKAVNRWISAPNDIRASETAEVLAGRERTIAKRALEAETEIETISPALAPITEVWRVASLANGERKIVETRVQEIVVPSGDISTAAGRSTGTSGTGAPHQAPRGPAASRSSRFFPTSNTTVNGEIRPNSPPPPMSADHPVHGDIKPSVVLPPSVGQQIASPTRANGHHKVDNPRSPQKHSGRDEFEAVQQKILGMTKSHHPPTQQTQQGVHRTGIVKDFSATKVPFEGSPERLHKELTVSLPRQDSMCTKPEDEDFFRDLFEQDFGSTPTVKLPNKLTSYPTVTIIVASAESPPSTSKQQRRNKSRFSSTTVESLHFGANKERVYIVHLPGGTRKEVQVPQVIGNGRSSGPRRRGRSSKNGSSSGRPYSSGNTSSFGRHSGTTAVI